MLMIIITTRGPAQRPDHRASMRKLRSIPSFNSITITGHHQSNQHPMPTILVVDFAHPIKHYMANTNIHTNNFKKISAAIDKIGDKERWRKLPEQEGISMYMLGRLMAMIIAVIIIRA